MTVDMLCDVLEHNIACVNVIRPSINEMWNAYSLTSQGLNLQLFTPYMQSWLNQFLAKGKRCCYHLSSQYWSPACEYFFQS